MKKEFRKIIKTLRKRGWIGEKNKRSHMKFTHVDSGHVIYTGSTPSDGRSLKNFMAHIRRVERELGIPDAA